jgi:hypothetical protein
MRQGRIAEAIRRREHRSQALAKSEARATERRRRRWERRVARRLRPRVEVIEGDGERTLVFRGPHVGFEFWMTWGMIGAMVVAPAVIGLGFVLPAWATGLLVGLVVTVYGLVIYSPLRVTVTDHGQFEVRRPFLPWPREVGRVSELEMTVCGYFPGGHPHYMRCKVESKRWDLFEPLGLAPCDVEVVERFDREIRQPKPVRSRPHSGGYRAPHFV